MMKKIYLKPLTKWTLIENDEKLMANSIVLNSTSATVDGEDYVTLSRKTTNTWDDEEEE